MCSAGHPNPDSDYFVSTEKNVTADLYVTYSGSHEKVGIYKFGKNRVSPPNEYKGTTTP